MTGVAIARGTRRIICRFGRALLAGPPLLIGEACTDLAAAISAGFGWLEGAPPAPALPVPVRRASFDDDGPDLLTSRRAARVLYAGGFDTAAIADLLTESEADVARWVCKRAGTVAP